MRIRHHHPVNEQDLFLKVGELATRTGYPMPSIRMVDAPRQNFVRLKPQGSVGPVLELRPEIWEIPAGRLEFFIAQDFVGFGLGVQRHRRGQLLVAAAIGGIGTMLVDHFFGGSVAFLTLFLVFPPLWTVATAVWLRVFQRRVDRRLTELFGRDWLESALQELVDVWHWHWQWRLRWVWNGAPPLPPERLGWVQKAA
jgi:hypothetical protein